jgi:hypothetical protein
MEEQVVITRDSIRTKLFNIKRRSKVITIDGMPIEIRQSNVGSLVALDQSDGIPATIRVMIDSCFVPGTDEPVFDKGDVEALKAMPFGEEWMDLVTAVDEISGLKKVMELQGKGSAKTEQSSPSSV